MTLPLNVFRNTQLHASIIEPGPCLYLSASVLMENCLQSRPGPGDLTAAVAGGGLQSYNSQPYLAPT